MAKVRIISTSLIAALSISWFGGLTRAQQTSSTEAPSSAYSMKPSSPVLFARMRPGRRGFSLMSSNWSGGGGSLVKSVAPQVSPLPAVHGAGNPGTIPMWAGTSPSGNSTLGDSIITQLNGNIGIGVPTPSSKLTVSGMIETTLGGYKFPDGTIQTTAAVSGLQSVIHDLTLTGDGTASSPLGVSFPLVLRGPTPGCCIEDRVLTLQNTSDGQHGMVVIAGGTAASTRKGGTGIFVFGGSSSTDDGGIGVSSTGGGSTTARGGDGVFTRGGASDSGTGGTAIRAFAGNSNTGEGGVGAIIGGGFSDNGPGGIGMSVGGNSSNNNSGGDGILASAGSSLNGGVGGNGVVARGGNFNGRGVLAFGGTGSVGYGVEATGGPSTGSGGTAGAGLLAKGGPSSGSNSASGFGLFAIAGDATNGAMRGRAGSFEGDVSITEHLTVGGNLEVSGTKNFKIDHPLDPENKYLLHASIESSEALNVYSGNIVTDAKGNAVILLPEWFEALNRDIRYQLTVIGRFAQAIVAKKVTRNRFTIKTNAPNVEVSWQVTGVRSDAVMQKHPFKTEEDKPPLERGSYLTPEAFGQPEERGVEWSRYPELMKKTRAKPAKQ